MNTNIPEFKYTQEEAQFRLNVKKELDKLGCNLGINEKNNLSTEDLVNLRDRIRSLQEQGANSEVAMILTIGEANGS